MTVTDLVEPLHIKCVCIVNSSTCCAWVQCCDSSCWCQPPAKEAAYHGSTRRTCVWAALQLPFAVLLTTCGLVGHQPDNQSVCVCVCFAAGLLLEFLCLLFRALPLV